VILLWKKMWKIQEKKVPWKTRFSSSLFPKFTHRKKWPKSLVLPCFSEKSTQFTDPTATTKE